MDEATYRQNQAVARMFGPSARIAGTAGSGRGPGEVRIVLDGRQLGRGGNFQEAMHDANNRLLADRSRICQLTPTQTGLD